MYEQKLIKTFSGPRLESWKWPPSAGIRPTTISLLLPMDHVSNLVAYGSCVSNLVGVIVLDDFSYCWTIFMSPSNLPDNLYQQKEPGVVAVFSLKNPSFPEWVILMVFCLVCFSHLQKLSYYSGMKGFSGLKNISSPGSIANLPRYQCWAKCGVMCVDIHPEVFLLTRFKNLSILPEQHPHMLVVGLYDGNVAVYNLQVKIREMLI